MKITDLKSNYYEVPLSKPFRTATSPGRISEKMGFTLVKIFTDEDIVGIGVQDVRFPEWSTYLEKNYKPFLLNNIVEPYYVEKFARYLRFQGPQSLAPRPCAIEIALWDIIGKKAKLPLYKLFGAYQDKVKAYASVLEPYPLWDPKQWTTFTEQLVNEGFKGIKLHIGAMWPDPDNIIEVVKEIRGSLGYGFDIMIDAMQAWVDNSIYDLHSSIKYANGLEKYECAWLEEPLNHFYNPDLSAQLCKIVDMPIAGGGAMFGLQHYKTVLEKGALDIVQPDVMHAGGLLEVRRIAQLAESMGRLCIPHYFGVGIGLAATLQVIGSLNVPWVEYPYHPPSHDLEARDRMITEPIKIDKNGYVEIPNKPGIGVELKEDVLDKYFVK
jgi:L-alanine-DL-glutamate epimerase-like enolase superfamily enzyme